MSIEAKIIADSVTLNGKRITTWELRYPRFIHAELMTHRLFCLAGESVLSFDLPSGQQGGKSRRLHEMTLADFYDKWHNGARRAGSRYAMKDRLKKMKIRQVNEKTGEIQTSNVVDVFYSGKKEVYVVAAEGCEVAGSADHRVLTAEGWKTIGELTPDDRLLVEGRGKSAGENVGDKFKKVNGRWRSTWQNGQRKRLIKENPVCRACLLNLGSEIHHIVPVHADPSRAFDETNVTLLCTSCHKNGHEKQGWQAGIGLKAVYAKVESVVLRGVEDTYDLEIAGEYPNFFANGVVVHNSRNASSSRAIPTKKILSAVWKDPAVPVSWGRNRSGMGAKEELSGIPGWLAKKVWLWSRLVAIVVAWTLNKLGLHKQIANRVLEPWSHITVLLTATEFNNWFRLRCHPDAQPEIQALACKMRSLYREHIPRTKVAGEWHLPYIEGVTISSKGDNISKLALKFLKVCVARCARVSYLNHNGKVDPEADVRLHDQLLESGHMCYDRETEVLTSGGWKKWPSVSERDELLAVDIKTNTGKFELPSALHKYDIDEDLYRLSGQQVDLAVTKNHNLVTSHRKNSKNEWTPFCLEQADEVFGKPHRTLTSCKVEFSKDTFPQSFENSTNFFKLMGFFVGDGYAESRNTISFHLKKARKIEYLKSLGFSVEQKVGNKFKITLPGLGEWFETHCYYDKQKKIPEWVLQAHDALVSGLLDGLKNSDGSLRRGAWVYSTTSQQVADMVQAILHTRGFSGGLTFTKMENPEHKTVIRINVSRRVAPRIEIYQKGRSYSYEERYERYTGPVYCATVSTGALLTRRNGKVVVSGNSPFEHAAMALDSYKWSGNFQGWKQYREVCDKNFTKVGKS